MKTYLVGGAVRDAALGLPVADRDWVVVGATTDTMLNAGYKQVGKDFPVFLHPETNEEYALARTERKSGMGHHGFDMETGTHVTLEQDLSRRDLTINAMAKSEDGTVVDPWGGREDLRDRVLRHVSPAFAEDPLRVLRTARFAARLAPFGFTVAAETRELMRSMATSGELETLPAERLCQEMTRALATANPRVFVEALRACGALAVLWPELDKLFGVPQVATHHPEIDSGEHTLMVLDQAVLLDASIASRFAALCHDLGKGTTEAAQLPRHIGHEERGVPLTEASSKRFKAPRDWRELAVMTTRWHTHCHRALELRPGTLVDTLASLDTLRRPERFEAFLTVCTADARGKLGRERDAYPQAEFMRRAARAIASVDAGSVVAGVAPDQRQAAVRTARIDSVRQLLARSDAAGDQL